VADDVFLANRDDWEFALRLNEDYDRLDFRGLLERYYELSPEIPPALRARQIEHILGGPERFVAALRRSLRLRCLVACDRVLDLGCGTGSVLHALAGGPLGLPTEERWLWGVDIAMRWLLLARKRLDEAGFPGVRLVCGCAEALPFADASFGGITGGDVIEHVADQSATLAECHRVLKPWGRLHLATPNRFSLAPEPHVQVWGVGFLPRRWMGPYVRWVRGVDFRAIRTLDLREWRTLLRASPFGGGEIEPAVLSEADLRAFRPLKRALARIYNAAATGPGGPAVLAFGPFFQIHCSRTEAPPGPSPATRPRSRLQAVSA
jgi:SAM-dependent methyltransferase